MNTRNIIFTSNRFHDVETVYHQYLDSIYGQLEVRTFLLMLAEKYLGWDTTAYLLHRHETINQSVLLNFHWALKDLERQRPIQHIIGNTTFCNCTIEVSPSVLIPRPETEEIVLLLIQHLRNSSFTPTSILDLCTGSGCIAIALKRAFPSALVVGADISAEALTIARKNAKSNAADITFLQTDILNHSDWSKITRNGTQKQDAPTDKAETRATSIGKDTSRKTGSKEDSFDIIISNPPYICESERTGMHCNVLDYEPAIALFVKDSDPLVFYRSIGEFALQHLSPKGILALEINEHLGNKTRELLSSLSLLPILFQDFAGKDRCIFCKKDSSPA